MPNWEWNLEKNLLLRREGPPTFEEVLQALDEGGFRAIEENKAHRGQQVIVVMIRGYAHAVPFRDEGDKRILLTVYPSRGLQKRYGKPRHET